MQSPIVYACKRCHREIFRPDEVIGKIDLWSFGTYRSTCYLLASASGQSALRRYDCSLHEGWYCCQFVLMRMTVDKFGTGDDLLVYEDSVEPRPAGSAPRAKAPYEGAPRLGARDFDAVTAGPSGGKLRVVKFGAIWCPPCRMTDRAIAALCREGTLPEVDFFEVDVDEEREFAARFRYGAIPYFRFYYEGKLVPPAPLAPPGVRPADGGLVGALPPAALASLCRRALAFARGPLPAYSP